MFSFLWEVGPNGSFCGKGCIGLKRGLFFQKKKKTCLKEQSVRFASAQDKKITLKLCGPNSDGALKRLSSSFHTIWSFKTWQTGPLNMNGNGRFAHLILRTICFFSSAVCRNIFFSHRLGASHICQLGLRVAARSIGRLWFDPRRLSREAKGGAFFYFFMCEWNLQQYKYQPAYGGPV